MKQINLVIIVSLFLTIIPLHSEEKEKTIFDDVRAGDIHALQDRITKRQNCSVKDADGNSVLHIIAEENPEKSEEMITILTTEPDYSDWLSLDHWLRWSYDGVYGTATLPHKDLQNNKGDTALHCALKESNEKAALCLCEKNARTDIKNNAGHIPAFDVIAQQNEKSIPLLIKCKLIDQKQDGDNLIHYAVLAQKDRMLHCLLEHKKSLADAQNESGKTAAILAAELSTPVVLSILKQHGINFNTPGGNGLRPLHYSSKNGNTVTTTFLLDNGASTEVADYQGNYPLHYAAYHDRLKTLDILLAYKADVMATNLQGKNPFMLAIEHDCSSVANRLSSHPALDINKRDKDGRTAFANAVVAGKHDMMTKLIKTGARLDSANNDGDMPIHEAAALGNCKTIEIIVEKDRSSLGQINREGNNPLFVSAAHGNRDALWLFNGWGQSLRQKNKYGESILHQIAKSTNTHLFDEVLRAHNDPSVLSEQDYDGNTVAHAAVLSDKKSMIMHFMEKYSYLFDMRNKQSDTPFLYAVRNDKGKTVTCFNLEKYFINGDVRRGILIAKNGHYNIKRWLQDAENLRNAEWDALNEYYRSIEMTINENKLLCIELRAKDPSNFNGTYIAGQPQYYSKEEFYYFSDAQRVRIKQEHTNRLNGELANKNYFTQQLNLVLERIRKHEQDEQARKLQQQLDAQKQEYETINAQDAEFKRLEQKRKDEQQKELDRCAQEKKKADETRAQQQEYNRLAAAKAAADQLGRQQKHQHALEGQHIPQPSAPPMEEVAAVSNACAQCKNIIPNAKPLTCVKCKTTIQGVCPKCTREHNNNRCSSCSEIFVRGTTEKKGKCLLCLEEDITVTNVPCKGCNTQESSAQICGDCLTAWFNNNKNTNHTHKCPQCRGETLEDDLLKKIFAQNKKPAEEKA